MRPASIFFNIQLSNSRGRPNMAQAGGKNPDKVPEALEAAANILADQIK